jgi:hypothetical protein
MIRLSLSRPEWHVWAIRDGKAVRVEWFEEQAVAVRFAGLDEAREQQVKAELPPSPLERRQMDSERRAGALLKTGGWVSR